ncbi:MAG: N-acetylglucosamine-6-phosphate deacetylase, partial [Bauldia litoralis]
MTVIALTGARIFDGKRLRDGEAVLIDGTRIAGIVATGDVPADAEQRAVEGLIAPGFVDVQVNGGGGVLFNDARTVEGIAAIGAAHRRYGTTGFLPTLITDSFEATTEAMAAAEAALAEGVPGLLGIHLEGPFLNPERKGAHQASFMRPVEEADIALMTGLTRGRTLVTLAPEMV